LTPTISQEGEIRLPIDEKLDPVLVVIARRGGRQDVRERPS